MEIELRQVTRAAVRWSWLIVLTTLLVAGLAYLVTSRQPSSYSAMTTLLVNPQQVSGAAENQALQASQTQAQTYVRLVESGPVLERVIDELNLPYSRSELAEKIDASVVMNTQLIEITVSDSSPENAARIANVVGEQFEAQVEDLSIGRLEENLAQIQGEINTLQNRQVEIDDRLAELDRDDVAAQQEISALGDDLLRVAETLADLNASVRGINAALATTTSPVAIADQAEPPQEPDSPKPALMTALGLFLGFLLGAGVAVLLELMDKKVRPETDIEALTGSRLLATIPRERRSVAGQPLVLSRTGSPATEAIRVLRTRLGTVASKDAHSAVVFTSAGGAAGTSDVVANLGVVMAQAGLCTLILEANMRDPNQHVIFNAPNEEGLSSILAAGADPAVSGGALEVCDRLRVIPAGMQGGDPAQFLSSSAFASLLHRARQEADVILIDAPPALEYSDAMSVAAVSDAVVLVGRYGATSRDDLVRLAATMEADGIRLLGVVMELP